MSRLRPRRPSPALVVSTIALIAALGGTSYAAFSLPKNSVGTKQLKNGAVTGPKIKNGTIGKAKLNVTGLVVPDALRAGSATNATNASHAASADTVTGQGTLASGHTEIGIIGGRFQNGATANSPMGISTTFPLMAPVALDNSHIQVAPTAQCSGSTANPTAARGYVCIYPDILVSANGVSGNTGVAGDMKLGFQMEWNATTANAQSSVRAEWAYTAP